MPKMTNEMAANVLRIMATGIKLNGYTEHWISGFKEAYEMAIKTLEEKSQGGWIPVSKRWPAFTGLYLVSIDDLVTAMSFDGTGFRNHGGVRIEVDAWMSLPKSYKKAVTTNEIRKI